jgi:hypothetical protein
MTNIPHARKLITHALELLGEAQSLMTRPKPIRRAKPTSRRMTPEIAKSIRLLAKRHPSWKQDRIAAHFNVDGGRVSEALRGKR